MNKKRKTSTLVEEESEDDLVGDLLDDAFSQSEDDEAAELSADERSASEDESEDGDEDDEADEEAEDEDEDALSDDETPDNQIHNELKANGELNGHRKGAEYSVVTDANGGERYVYREIDPVYDSDDTDAQEPVNTIGDIPLSFYDAYPHIGYDIHGKKVMRPASKEALDALLDKMEVPEGWTGLLDKETGDGLKISREELELIRRVQGSLIPEEGYNPYEEALEWFTNVEEKMPLSSAPEPKRRFLPSKHEAKRIMKMVRAIREGRLLPYKPPEEREEEVEEDEVYDIWANEEPREESIMHIPAPKLPPPGYDQSYNPPPEYLPTKQEKEAWEKLEPEEREKDYLPASYPSLRQVPGWDLFTKSRFERCLDLYLAPRVRKNRLNIDPNSLLPKMPKPEELRPFPTVCQTVFRGHEGYIRSVDIDPTGNFLASGGDDGVIRVWDILTGRCVWSVRLQTEDPIDCVRWRPSKDAFILSAVSGEEVFLIIPPMLVDFELEEASRKVLDAGFGYKAQSAAATKEPAAKWERPGAKLEDEGVLLRLTVRSAIKAISWHRRGDHFCTTSPRGQRSSIIVHTLSKHLSQIPFRKLSGLAQAAHFHPSRPLFFVATQRMIRVYDLQKLELIKVLQPGAKLISSFDIHQGGDNVVVGSYDKRLLWMDLDLSVRPYKTMRFHDEAVRSVKYHKGGLPLFADCSDDGTIQIFHGKVANDLMANPTIIPVKALRGHSVVKRLGVMDICWHPQQPWLVSAGADGTCRLWM